MVQAKLRTQDKSGTYRALKAELYKNVNDIMKEQYQNMLDVEKRLQEDVGLLLGSASLIGSIGFDLLGGVVGGIGSATFGIVQALANFGNNVYDIFDESDGRSWEEDLFYTVGSMGGNILKGIGTAGISLGAMGGTLLGIEGAQEWGEEASRITEDWVNTTVIGGAIAGGRFKRFQNTGENVGFGGLDDPEYIKQYINDRYDPTSASAAVKTWAADSNRWYQKNIADPLKETFDETTLRGPMGEFYGKYLEPAATSIGELVPSILMSKFGASSGSKEVAKIANNLSRAFFAAKAYGSSYQEAVDGGATPNDAHIYGMAIAGVEFATEMIGGFVPGKPLSASFGSVGKSILTEGLEEFVAEIVQPGLNFWTSDERNFEETNQSELWERAFYAATVGAISGGVFGVSGAIGAIGSPESSVERINQQLSKNFDKMDNQAVAREVGNLEQRLNDPTVPQWRKDQILQNPLYRELIQETKVEGTNQSLYSLTQVGQRFAQGEFRAMQGDKVISKEEYAVGSQEFATNYVERNKFGEIEIVRNDEVPSLNEKQQSDLEFFREKDARVVLYKQDTTQGDYEGGAFVDLNTGTVYINVNSASNAQGFKNAYGHELSDYISNLAKEGKLNKTQQKAYTDFIGSINDGEFDNVLDQTGWGELEEAYITQSFNEEQRALAKDLGWENVPLTPMQERMLARERVSHVVGNVFDNETIFRNAFRENPSILKRIANIFAKKETFQEQFDVEGGVLPEMLTNMQRNFQNLLRQTRDFIFAPESVAGGMLQQMIVKPSGLFTPEAYLLHAHKESYLVTEQFELEQITQNEESMMAILGYDMNFDFNKDDGSYIYAQRKIDHEYFAKYTPQMGNNLDNYYKEIEGKDYFLKVGRKLYDRNQFKIPEGAEKVRIGFVDNNYFEMRLKYGAFDLTIVEGNQIEIDNDIFEIDVNENMLIKRIYPDVEMNDGRIINNPIIMFASMGPERIEFMLREGILPSQSINMQSAGGMTLGSQEFERLIVGENGHEFTITLAFRNQVANDTGFTAFRKDASTPTTVFKKEQETFVGQEDLYLKLDADYETEIVREVDAINGLVNKPWTTDGKWFITSFKNKNDILKRTIDVIIAQAENSINKNYNVDDIEVVNRNLTMIIDTLDRVARSTNTRLNRESLKRRINRQAPSPIEVFEMARKASKSLQKLFNSFESNQTLMENFDSNERVFAIGRMLDFAMNGTFYTNPIYQQASNEFREDINNIVEYMNISPFETWSVAEAELAKGIPTQIGAAYITHLGENKNSNKYNEIKSFLENNGVFVSDFVSELDVEGMKNKYQYDPMQGDFLNTSAFKYKHIDKGRNSIVTQALEDDANNNLNLAFQVTRKTSTKPKSQTKKNGERNPVLKGLPAKNIQEQNDIDKTETLDTQRTFPVQEDAKPTPIKKISPEQVLSLLESRVDDIVIETFNEKGEQYVFDGIVNQKTGKAQGPRAYTVVSYKGMRIPFYLSSGESGKIKTQKGKWYPILGVSSFWINKPSDTRLSEYYGNSVLRGLSEYLDKTIGDVRPEISKKLEDAYKQRDLVEKVLTKANYAQLNSMFPTEPSIDADDGIPTANRDRFIDLGRQMLNEFRNTHLQQPLETQQEVQATQETQKGQPLDKKYIDQNQVEIYDNYDLEANQPMPINFVEESRVIKEGKSTNVVEIDYPIVDEIWSLSGETGTTSNHEEAGKKAFVRGGVYNHPTKGWTSRILQMTPLEYIERAQQIFGKEVTVDEIIEERKNDYNLDEVFDPKKGDIFYPVLDIRKRNQEGLHRAVWALENNIESMPVIVIEETSSMENFEQQQMQQEQVVDEQMVDETQEVTPPPTPTIVEPQTQFTNNFLNNTQNTAANTKKITYRVLEKSFNSFLEETYPEILKEKNPQFKAVQEIYEQYKEVISKTTRGNRYVNHVTSAVMKTLVQELSNVYTLIKNDKSRRTLALNKQEVDYVIEKVNEAIFSSMDYMSDLVSKRYVSEDNPTGMIYAKYSHWFLRDFMDADFTDIDVVRQFGKEDARGNFYRRLINAVRNINKKDGFRELNGALGEFFRATDIEKVNDMSLISGDTQRTASEVKRQWVDNARKIDRVKRDIKYNTLLNPVVNSLIDPYSFFEIQGLFDKQSWSGVLSRKLIQAQKDMIEVDRIFEEIIQSENWLKDNYKEIKKLENEKNAVEIVQLGGVKLTISQAMFLRDMMIREIVRNRAIDMGIIDGNKSEHFRNGYEINILAMQEEPTAKWDKRTTAKIQDVDQLVQELDRVVNESPVAIEYSNKSKQLFAKLFPLVNERFTEINGQPLQNEGMEIQQRLAEMSQEQQNELFQNLPENVNAQTVANIYVPILVGRSGYFKEDTVSVQNIIDLGVFDGMAQSIGEDSTSAVSVESLTNVIYKYKKEVRNYYGLHRVMRDWSQLINENIEGEVQQTNLRKYFSQQSITYIETLMKDMAGYKPTSSFFTNKTFGFFRRNFYRAALAGNIKVIFTQLNTIYNLSLMYAPNPATFFPTMYKNLFMQLSTENKAKVKELESTSNIYYDRSYQATFDIGEASTQGIDSNSSFNRIINMMMSGIQITDTAINSAFYLTLLETINPETNTFYTKEEATEMMEEGIIRSQSSALDLSKAPILRTQNEIIKSMVKFLGEPLKLQSQIYTAKKKLEYINKLEKNKSVVDDNLNREENEARATLDQARAKLEELQRQEDNPDFATLDIDKQMKIRKNIDKQALVVKEVEIVYDETTRIANDVRNSIDSAINSRGKTINDLKRRVSALIGSMLYMAGLGVGWSLLLNDMGRLDDREEEEELLKYIVRKMGLQLGNEFAGLFPFIRDIYGYLSQGYDFAAIDEIALFQEPLGVFRDLVKDMVEGNDINPYKYARRIAIAGGRLGIGLPLRNLENIGIMAMMVTGNQDDYYRYRALTGQRVSSNKELARAIVDGRDDLVQAIVETRLSSRQVTMSSPVVNEIADLARRGKNVTLTGVNDSYIIEGIEYTLTQEQKEEFRVIYSRADFVIQRLITNPGYLRLNDDKKASLLRSVYSYFLRLAQKEVLGADTIPESRDFRSLTQIFGYFSRTVIPSLKRDEEKERREALRKRP